MEVKNAHQRSGGKYRRPSKLVIICTTILRHNLGNHTVIFTANVTISDIEQIDDI
jgi:hypothetical protein